MHCILSTECLYLGNVQSNFFVGPGLTGWSGHAIVKLMLSAGRQTFKCLKTYNLFLCLLLFCPHFFLLHSRFFWPKLWFAQHKSKCYYTERGTILPPGHQATIRYQHRIMLTFVVLNAMTKRRHDVVTMSTQTTIKVRVR